VCAIFCGVDHHRPFLGACVVQGAAGCCRVLQGVAGCCRVLQGVAGCCRVLQSVAGCCRVLQFVGRKRLSSV